MFSLDQPECKTTQSFVLFLRAPAPIGHLEIGFMNDADLVGTGQHDLGLRHLPKHLLLDREACSEDRNTAKIFREGLPSDGVDQIDDGNGSELHEFRYTNVWRHRRNRGYLRTRARHPLDQLRQIS